MSALDNLKLIWCHTQPSMVPYCPTTNKERYSEAALKVRKSQKKSVVSIILSKNDQKGSTLKLAK